VNSLAIFGASSKYAGDLVESAKRLGKSVTLINNLQQPIDSPTYTTIVIEEPKIPVIVAPASYRERATAVSNAMAMGASSFANLIDPTSVIASTANFGCGNYVNSLASIASFVQIQCHTNINRNSAIGHHCLIESFVSTGPGVILCGSVEVGLGCFIGAGTTILPNVKIGRNVVIGAGSVVTKDLPSDVIAYGNPAQVMKPNQPWEGLVACPAH